jgi:hypothetical protein
LHFAPSERLDDAMNEIKGFPFSYLFLRVSSLFFDHSLWEDLFKNFFHLDAPPLFPVAGAYEEQQHTNAKIPQSEHQHRRMRSSLRLF